MKRTHKFLLLLVGALTLAGAGSSAVLVEDNWSDGDRTDTNLPEECAWFASSAGGMPSLTAGMGSLTGTIRMFETNTASRLWITHFTSNALPADLAIGETLKITLGFTPSNVTTSSSTSRGFRLGLFNFSEPGAARVAADGFSTGGGGGAPGMNVTGYILNMNFAQTFTITSPLQIMKRTDIPNINLMGASAAYTGISSGGGRSDNAGFSNDVQYTFTFSVKRNESSVDITTAFSDEAGWTISHTATDSTSPNTRFDTLALRPNSVADVADALIFSRIRAEVIPFQVRITSSQLDAITGMVLVWNTLPNRTYQVEMRPSLDVADDWVVLASVPGTGDAATYSDMDALFDPQRFYRVVQLP